MGTVKQYGMRIIFLWLELSNQNVACALSVWTDLTQQFKYLLTECSYLSGDWHRQLLHGRDRKVKETAYIDYHCLSEYYDKRVTMV